MNLYKKDESYKIIEASIAVHKKLGEGFLEEVYQEALQIELEKRSIPYNREVKLDIYYDNIKLKKYYKADYICYHEIILELKAEDEIKSRHKSQVINYLKATGYPLGIIINFGAPRLQQQRLIRHSSNISLIITE